MVRSSYGSSPLQRNVHCTVFDTLRRSAADTRASPRPPSVSAGVLCTCAWSRPPSVSADESDGTSYQYASVRATRVCLLRPIRTWSGPTRTIVRYFCRPSHFYSRTHFSSRTVASSFQRTTLLKKYCGETRTLKRVFPNFCDTGREGEHLQLGAVLKCLRRGGPCITRFRF